MASKHIENAVANKDFFAMRGCLVANILVDKNLTTIFKEDFEYCLSHGISESEIYEQHNGKDINGDYNKEHYDRLRAELTSNFSKERLDMLKKIAIKLYPPKIDSNNNQGGSNNNTSNNYQRCGDSARHVKTDKDGNKLIYAIVAGVAVLIGIVLFAG